MNETPSNEIIAELERFARWCESENPDSDALLAAVRKQLRSRSRSAFLRLCEGIRWADQRDYRPFKGDRAQMRAIVDWAIALERFDATMRAAARKDGAE